MNLRNTLKLLGVSRTVTESGNACCTRTWSARSMLRWTECPRGASERGLKAQLEEMEGLKAQLEEVDGKHQTEGDGTLAYIASLQSRCSAAFSASAN